MSENHKEKEAQNGKQSNFTVDYQHYMKKVDEFLDQKPIRGLFDEIDKFFHKHGIFSSIGVEIFEHEDNLIVQASLPGVLKEQIYMDIEGSILTIGLKNTTEQELINDKDAYSFKKYSYSQSQRIVKLPYPIDATTATATYENGLLIIKGKKMKEYQKQIFVD